MEKGDNGKVEFLEGAVGLSLSSAMNVARHLSAETLPGLIEKVNYVKKIFFSDSSDGGLTGKNAHRMMMHLSIPIDDDLQQTLSFFEKTARRGGLDMLGSGDSAFRCLIESFPRLLLLSLDPQVRPFVEYLENIGVPREIMRNIFLLFPPVIFCNIKVIKTRVLAFKEVLPISALLSLHFSLCTETLCNLYDSKYAVTEELVISAALLMIKYVISISLCNYVGSSFLVLTLDIYFFFGHVYF
ncbi:uncharacterized protein [Pyrus communis]|uniref:uncharacterized protein isoform X1 n=1 Tax=Pyrus communis TaxID=23211 RepID=UPI0035C1D885